MPEIDATPEQVATVKAILRRHVPDREVWAFGSRARWTAKEYSDLDLVILGDELLPSQVHAALVQEFDDSDLPWKVDVVEWATISSNFRGVIKKGYAVIQTDEIGLTCAEGGWPRHEIGQLLAEGKLTIGDGYRAKNTELTRFGLPFARAGNINNGFQFDDADYFPESNLARVGSKISQPGDVVFTSKGTVGRFAIVRPDTPRFVYSPQLCYWRSLDRNVIEPRYLYYWMLGREFYLQFKGVAGQTDMAEYVSLADQRSMHITLPPIREQRAIAHILGSLDDKIELNRRMSETLEAMARALFKSWFVDFDPVRAKAEGRDPGLLQHLAELFPDRLVDSELGDVPDGWEIGTLADVSVLNPQVWAQATRPVELRYVDLSNIKWGRIETVTEYTANDAPSRARRVLLPGDTIVGTVRPGNGSYALILEEDLTGSTGFAVLRPNTASQTEFVYLAATAAENIDVLAHLADGGAYPAVRPEVVAATPIVCPDGEVLKRFSLATRPLLSRMSKNERGSRTLATLRDALLAKLISGELRVNDTDYLQEVAE